LQPTIASKHDVKSNTSVYVYLEMKLSR